MFKCHSPDDMSLPPTGQLQADQMIELEGHDEMDAADFMRGDPDLNSDSVPPIQSRGPNIIITP